MIRTLETDLDSSNRSRAAALLGVYKAENSVYHLCKALQEDPESDVRSQAASALGEIGSKEVIQPLCQALKDKDPTVCCSAASALGKIGSNEAVPELHKFLEAQNIIIPSIVRALENIGSSQSIPRLVQYQNQIKSINHLILAAITKIKIRRESSYNPTSTQLDIPAIKSNSIRTMHILHLSDLHFGTLDQANLWSNQLAADLYHDLNIPHLDALILSGDIANFCTEEEYKAAEQFLHNFCQDFPLNPDQIILVPGNHDIDWKTTSWEKADDVAYTMKLRRQCKPHELQEGYYIEESQNAVWIRDDEKYKQRFAHFSSFYKTITQKPYPLEYHQQATLDHLKEQNLLILGLNSAWQLDHHYTTRASINTNALSNALAQIRRNPDYKNCLKIAVWHHPLDSAYSDRITDQGFLEQLAINGFRLFLHGHIHKAETSLFRYDMSTNGRKLDRICAGTFGAPTKELNTGIPWQYNLLKFEDNQLTVYTRCREELNGAWKPDARWGQGAGQEPLSYYAIAL
ncbi:HEAT repeat domain-containing protein [Trichocoleus sp. FACHB-90]|nr:HEAT repeat domain-containing protein [Trichocoleus sp. FACHB-90]MBD1928142.1 HEAT repeat domain-containing protein [Trichocoleus sp. FACHB-90]